MPHHPWIPAYAGMVVNVSLAVIVMFLTCPEYP